MEKSDTVDTHMVTSYLDEIRSLEDKERYKGSRIRYFHLMTSESICERLLISRQTCLIYE